MTNWPPNAKGASDMELIVELPNWEAAAGLLAGRAVALEVATRQGVGLVAHRVEAATKRELARTSHDRRTPTPSAPGQPPSWVSGDLGRSIGVQGPTGVGGTYEASVGPTMIYGRIQELGGRTGRGHSVTLPARPYLQPALAVAKPEILGIMTTAWRGALGV